MKAAYCFLRTVEHRLQMVNDEQTQTLPADRAAIDHFARFMGFADRDAFARALLGHLNKVQHYYARLFEKEEDIGQPALAQLKPTITRRSTGFRNLVFVRRWKHPASSGNG